MKKIIVTPQGIQELNLTAKEIAQREQDMAKAEQEKLAREQEIKNKLAKIESAKAKLTALGLDEEEVTALIGA